MIGFKIVKAIDAYDALRTGNVTTAESWTLLARGAYTSLMAVICFVFERMFMRDVFKEKLEVG